MNENKKMVSIFDDLVKKSLGSSGSSLTQADLIQQKCAQFGFDWKTIGPVVDKVHEELDEVMEEALKIDVDPSLVEEELGDLLFATVNLVRHLDCDPEVALAKANQKFMRRFQQVEMQVAEQNKAIEECSLEELDAEWNKVKKAESKQKGDKKM